MLELEGRHKLSSRILVIKAADDAASQYMSFMNVIFAGNDTTSMRLLTTENFYCQSVIHRTTCAQSSLKFTSVVIAPVFYCKHFNHHKVAFTKKAICSRIHGIGLSAFLSNSKG